MMRLIDADKMINLIDRVIAEKETLTYEEYAGSSLIASTKIEKDDLKFMKSFINNQPVVTMHKQGEWIREKITYGNNKLFLYLECSQCRFRVMESEKLNFCPYCGADMR